MLALPAGGKRKISACQVQHKQAKVEGLPERDSCSRSMTLTAQGEPGGAGALGTASAVQQAALELALQLAAGPPRIDVRQLLDCATSSSEHDARQAALVLASVEFPPGVACRLALAILELGSPVAARFLQSWLRQLRVARQYSALRDVTLALIPALVASGTNSADGILKDLILGYTFSRDLVGLVLGQLEAHGASPEAVSMYARILAQVHKRSLTLLGEHTVYFNVIEFDRELRAKSWVLGPGSREKPEFPYLLPWPEGTWELEPRADQGLHPRFSVRFTECSFHGAPLTGQLLGSTQLGAPAVSVSGTFVPHGSGVLLANEDASGRARSAGGGGMIMASLTEGTAPAPLVLSLDPTGTFIFGHALRGSSGMRTVLGTKVSVATHVHVAKVVEQTSLLPRATLFGGLETIDTRKAYSVITSSDSPPDAGFTFEAYVAIDPTSAKEDTVTLAQNGEFAILLRPSVQGAQSATFFVGAWLNDVPKGDEHVLWERHPCGFAAAC